MRSFRPGDSSMQIIQSSLYGSAGLKRITISSQDTDYYSTYTLDNDHITNEVYTRNPLTLKTGFYQDENGWDYNSVSNNLIHITVGGNVSIGGISSPDSMFTVVNGTWLKRGLRLGVPSGVGTKALRIDGNGNVTYADTTTSGSSITPAALTKTDDTNVTLTLGGTPSTALLQATSLTLGWTGTLADDRIASAATWNAKLTNPLTTTGDIIYSSSGTTEARLGIGSANTLLGLGNAGTAPEYKTVSNGLTAASGTLKLGGAQDGNTTIGAYGGTLYSTKFTNQNIWSVDSSRQFVLKTWRAAEV